MRVAAELLAAVLANELVQDVLLAIGPEPAVVGKWKHRESRDDPAYSASWHVARTRRAQRIYIVQLALRGLVTGTEIDHYASVIGERRRLGLWPKGQPPPIVLGHDYVARGVTLGRDGPKRATVALAASALSQCVKCGLQGLPENLDDYEQKARDRVLAFLGLERRVARPALTPAGAKKRRQRSAKAMAPIVAAERERLDAEVAAGRMVRVSEYAYVSAD